MSRQAGWALALALGLGAPATAAEFEFDLSGLGLGLISDTALEGSFRYDSAASIFTSVDITTATFSLQGGTGSILVDTAGPTTYFSFSDSASTLVIDLAEFNLNGTGIDSGESASFDASAVQGAPLAGDLFSIDGFPSDFFGGTVTVTNRVPQVSTETPTGPASPIETTNSAPMPQAPAGRDTGTPSPVPLPASLPLALMGLGTLIWLRFRSR